MTPWVFRKKEFEKRTKKPGDASNNKKNQTDGFSVVK
jgi:hypothetical protein